MINNKIKSAKGITLVSLTVTVVVLLILSSIIIYDIGDSLKIEKLKGMQSDIVNLREKISSYYAQNGEIPARITYNDIEHLRQAGVISEAVDTGDFLVIELSALENVTLNYGKDFEKVKINPDNVNNYKDLYIINQESHNIFYVAGIKIEDREYYTDYTSTGIDKKAVNLRYVNGVRIPEGYDYVENIGNTEDIVIENRENERYKWIPVSEKITENTDIPGITEEFVRSVNAYQGYYKREADTSVIHLGVENWSPIYDEEATYKDKNGDTAYIPKNFKVSETPGEDTINKGLVVKDANGNEWVWIEVPKSIYTTATSSTDYINIERDMHTYVNDYRDSEYTDTWYSEDQHGFITETEYKTWKNNMLKSVYEHGGFYIGRYETGTKTPRRAETNSLAIQRDAYPYNDVTCRQAQNLSKELATSGKTTSLMFGIQWDLVLKYIEVNAGKTQEKLRTNSEAWGNYSNATFSIRRGEYSTNAGTTFSAVTGKYTKPTASILLTTGATQRNTTLNIYDLAGNIEEWTLEYRTNTVEADTGNTNNEEEGSTEDPENTEEENNEETPVIRDYCVARGGNYTDNMNHTVFNRAYYRTTTAINTVGFRTVLY